MLLSLLAFPATAWAQYSNCFYCDDDLGDVYYKVPGYGQVFCTEECFEDWKADEQEANREKTKAQEAKKELERKAARQVAEEKKKKDLLKLILFAGGGIALVIAAVIFLPKGYKPKPPPENDYLRRPRPPR